MTARLGAAIALVVLASPLAGCSLALDFSGPLLDAAPIPDADLPDADPLAPDAEPDPKTMYEPNDSRDTATPITPGTYGPIAINPVGDHDFYKFTLTEAHDVTVDCLFTTAQGDLDMKLYDMAGTRIGESASVDDNEQITKTALAAGDYFIEVFGFNNQQKNDSYMLVLTVP